MPVSNSSFFKDWLQDWLIQDWLATNMELPEKKTKLDKQPERKRQRKNIWSKRAQGRKMTIKSRLQADYNKNQRQIFCKQKYYAVCWTKLTKE